MGMIYLKITSTPFSRECARGRRIYKLWYPRPQGESLESPAIQRRIKGLLEAGYTMKEIVPWFKFKGSRAGMRAGVNTPKANLVWAEIVKAYDNRCAYCGKKDNHLTKDHVVPVSKGGDDRMHNIVPACFECNRKKNARRLLNWDKFTHLQLHFLSFENQEQ